MTASASVINTERLSLRCLTADDAPMILALLNEPPFLQFIGDRKVRTLDDARAYITNGPMAMYERHGFGLWHTALRDTGEPIGICGLIKRDALPDVDVGFAFFPHYCGKGYATESAAAAIELGKQRFGLTRIVAVMQKNNAVSRRVLEKLGLLAEGTVTLAEGGDELELMVRDL
jgi:RimJ/RimL family protein N-acetyltransferase